MADVIDIGEERRRKPPKPTQADVAAAFARDVAKGRFAYCHGQERWFGWTGSIWKRLDKPDVFTELVAFIRKYAPDNASGAKMLESRWIMSVERHLRWLPDLGQTITDWDADPYLLGVPDGMVDLKTGDWIEASPTALITKTTADIPDEILDCPKWLAFVAEVTGGDRALQDFLQCWCGYCLTGDTSEQSLVFMCGSGGNGKGVFLNTVKAIMKDYAKTAPADTFIGQKLGHPAQLAMLVGARLITVSETREGDAWAEDRIKLLTGGDPIPARFMHKDYFEYQPQFKLTFTGNHQPTIDSVDDAMRRRLNIVPFDFKPITPDPTLPEKLWKERRSILRWMIEGCVKWQATGLPHPDIVLAATEEYFSTQDVMAQFIEENFDVDRGNTHLKCTSKAIFRAWTAFAKDAGEPIGSQKTMGARLKKMGFPRAWAGRGVRGFSGLSLRYDDLV